MRSRDHHSPGKLLRQSDENSHPQSQVSRHRPRRRGDRCLGRREDAIHHRRAGGTMSNHLDAKLAAIVWSENDAGKITDVMISYPEHITPDRGHLWNSSGVVHADWMSGSDPRLTPEGVFADMLATGFADNYWLAGA